MKNCFDWISRRKAYKMTGISADDVRKRVARKLGDAAEEEERTRLRMKKRLILSVVLAALFLISAAAATSYHISKLVPENIEQVQEYIQTKPVKKSLGEFEVTVHEALCDENYTYLAVSVRGLTDKAKKQLFNEEFENHHMNWMMLLDAYVEGTADEMRHRMKFEKEEALCTEDTVYMIGEMANPNPEHKPIIISLEDFFMKSVYPGVTVTDTITVPFGDKIGSSFTITPNQKVTAYKDLSDATTAVNSLKQMESQITVNKVSLSQLGLRIDYTDDTQSSILDGCIFMQMTDGSIRTFNQLFTFRIGYNGGEYGMCHSNASFRELQDMKNFKALVIGSTAYPLDGGKAYQVTIPQKCQPFLLTLRQGTQSHFIDPAKIMESLDSSGEKYEWDPASQTITILSDDPEIPGTVMQVGTKSYTVPFYPVKDLCDHLGAGYQWDAVGKKATIQYDGRTFVLPVGTSNHSCPGEDAVLDVELKLIDGKPYASGALAMALCLTETNTGTNENLTVIFP